LCRSNFILGVSQGRHRYFRLAGEEAAQGLEGLLALRNLTPSRKVPGSCPEHLREARYCYNHIAGRLGVGICRVLFRNVWIEPGKRDYQSTIAASPLLDMLSIRGQTALLPARLCLDWSERQYHLAGELGSSLLKGMLDRRWLLRGEGRALTLTPNGKRHLSAFGVRE
jgi:hypothetical protein